MRSSAFVAIAFALVALALGACGSPGSSSSSGAGTTEITAGTPTVAPTAFVSVPGFTDDEVRNYLVSLAFSSGLTVNTVLKWQKPISVYLYGASTQEDRATVEGITAELGMLTALSFSFAASAGQENMSIRFIPATEFAEHVRDVLPLERVGFNIFRRGEVGIGSTTIVVDTSATPAPLSSAQRSAFLRRMVTQSLGLVYVGNDKYPDSIFYRQFGADQPSALSALDKKVIQLFYSDRVRIGMSEQQLRAALTP